MTKKEVLDWLYRIKSKLTMYFPLKWVSECEQAVDYAIEALENQKTGHWIKDGDSYSDLYDYKIRCHCSICGNEKFFIDRKTTSGTPCIKNCDNVDKYCSNCGAKMEGENK